MKEDLQLGYLLLEASDPERLEAVFVDVLGLVAVPAVGATAFRMDDWERRFVVLSAEADRLAAVGLVAASEAAYATILSNLRAAGIEFRPGTAQECDLRAVGEFVGFTDPAGLPVEVATSPAQHPTADFVSARVPGGFLTGSQGLGHVVALTDDPESVISFYTSVLGFVVSDTVEEETPEGRLSATFMHCNRRHHTLAFGKRPPHVPASKVLGHVMVQANDVDAVGMAYDRALDAGLPIFRTLGRHPNDGMLSFYLRTAAGFDIEFGTGAVEVGDDWQVKRHAHASSWGHRRGQGFS